MLQIIKKIYNTYIGRKLFVKIFILNSLVLLILIVLLGNIFTASFISRIKQEEMEKQQFLIDKMRVFTEVEYNKICKMIIQVYADNQISSSFAEIMMSEQSSENMNIFSDDLAKMESFIKGFFLSDENIIDIIFISETNNLFYTSMPHNRSNSKYYNFSSHYIYRETYDIELNKKMYLDTEQAYIITSKSPVITFVDSIYDPRIFPSRSIIGKYYINLSLDGFFRTYIESAQNTRGSLFITNDRDIVLFSSDNTYLNKKFPFSDDVNEIDITINKATLNASGLNIYVVTRDSELIWDVIEIRNRINIIVLFCIFIGLLMNIILSMSFGKRIRSIIRNMKRIEEGDFDIRIDEVGKDEIGVLIGAFNEMGHRLKDYINKVYKSEIKAKTAELITLQSKINPHFIYNTIECIRMKALSNRDFDVSDMMMHMGKLFRWRFKEGHNIVTIEDELEFIRSYLELQKVVYGEKLYADIQIEEDLLDCGILKLLLQPVVENAFTHGLFPKQGGTLSIQVLKNNDEVNILIIDSGIGIEFERLVEIQGSISAITEETTADQFGDHLGLINVHQRILLAFGHPYGLQIMNNEDGGVRVVLVLPRMSMEEMKKHVQGDYR